MRTAPPLWVLRTAFRTVGVLAPRIAARWAETIFCSPPRHEPRPGEEAFLRAVGEAVGPLHGLIGHSLGGAAVSLAMRDGYIPTLAQAMTTPALIIHDRDDPDVPYDHGVEIARAG